MTRANGRSHGLSASDRLQQQRQAVDLRKAGHDYATIGQALGVSEATASRRVSAALRADVSAQVQTLRELESARLDAVLSRLTTILDDEQTRPTDKIQALRTMVSTVSERRALMGLAPPTKVELDATASLPGTYVQSIVQQAMALNAGKGT